jgi:hypothetical protein
LYIELITISGVFNGESNGQLPISFGDLLILIFISKFLPIEILLLHNCLFIFELDSNFFFPSSESCPNEYTEVQVLVD